MLVDNAQFIHNLFKAVTRLLLNIRIRKVT